MAKAKARAKTSRDVMADIVKYHFWILSGCILLTIVVTWFTATSGVKKSTKKFAGDVENKFTAVSRIRSDARHPNEKSHKEKQAVHKKHRLELAAAWKQVEQIQKQVLVWPQNMDPKFVAKASKLIPIEEKIPFPSGDELIPQHRQLYKDYVVALLPQLAEAIGAQWKVDVAKLSGGIAAGPGATGGGGGGNKDEDDGVMVRWPKNSQTTLAKRFVWEKRMPTTLEVMYAQEDLWVLQAIMGVVHRTNANADGRHNATIREIVGLDIAKDVQGVADIGKVHTLLEGALVSPVGGGAMGGGGDADAGGAGMMAAMLGDEQSQSSQEAGPVASLDPVDKRYVDNSNEPIAADKLRAAMASNKVEDAPLAVAKRIPIRIRVKMDLHKIPHLLAACGNSPLPIQVRQVRINGANGTSGGSGGGGGFTVADTGSGTEDSAAGGASMMMMMMGGAGGAGGAGKAAALQSRTAKESYPYEEEVEVYGVVYIYNPYNGGKIGIQPEDLQPAAAADQPAADAGE